MNEKNQLPLFHLQFVSVSTLHLLKGSILFWRNIVTSPTLVNVNSLSLFDIFWLYSYFGT